MIPPIDQFLSSINRVVQKVKQEQAKEKEKKKKEEKITNKQNQIQ